MHYQAAIEIQKDEFGIIFSYYIALRHGFYDLPLC